MNHDGQTVARPVRVLLADDAAVVRRGLTDLLQEIEGAVLVGEAADAPEALKQIETLRPDVVVLDLRMPGGGGLAVLEALRGRAERPVVIVLTNYPDPAYRDSCLSAGADHFLDKSTQFDRVGDILRELVARTSKCSSPKADTDTTAGAATWSFVYTPRPEFAARGLTVEAIRARLEGIGEVVQARSQMQDAGAAFQFIVRTTAPEETFAPWVEDGLTWSLLEPAAPTEPAETPPATAKRKPRKKTAIAPKVKQAEPAAAAEPAKSKVQVNLGRSDELQELVNELAGGRKQLAEQIAALSREIQGRQDDDLQKLRRAMEQQRRVVDTAIEEVNDLSRSLKMTKTATRSLTGVAEKLLASTTEMADSIQQVTASTGDLAGAITGVSAPVKESASTIEQVASTSEAMARSASEVSAAITQVTASLRSLAREAAGFEDRWEAEEASAGAATQRLAKGMRQRSEQLAADLTEMDHRMEEVADTLEQTSRSVEGVAANGRQIARLADQSASNVARLDRTIQSVVDLAKQADESSAQAARNAEEGSSVVEDSIASLLRVRDAMNRVVATIRSTCDRAVEIGGVLNTISLLAERTNLLSLNASIEAARSGDAGQGFAAVTAEIRTLADRSAQATAEISRLIHGLHAAADQAAQGAEQGLRLADESSRSVERAATGFERVLARVEETNSMLAEITRTTEEQVRASQAVIGNVNATAIQAGEVARATTEQLAAIADVAKAMSEVRQLAHQVVQVMNEQGKSTGRIMAAADDSSRRAAEARQAMARQVAKLHELLSELAGAAAAKSARRSAGRAQGASANSPAGSAARLVREMRSLAGSMKEQVSVIRQITEAGNLVREQAEQAGMAIARQTRLARDLTSSTRHIATQIGVITQANLEQSAGIERLQERLAELRDISDRQTTTNTLPLR